MKKGVIAYLAIAFGLAWLLWEIPIRCGVSPTELKNQWAFLPGTFSPAIAAIIVRKWITGEGFADAGLRLNLRQHWIHYLVAWLLPLVVVTIVTLLAVLFAISQPDFTMQRFLAKTFPNVATHVVPIWVWFVLPVQMLITSLITTVILWGEEFGWRGYLQLRLFPTRPVLSAVVTGLIWGVWHYPLNLRGYNYPDHRLLGLLVFPVGTVMLSIIFGWLRLRTGSIWSASLAHAATNAVGGSLLMLLFLGGPNWIFLSYLGVLAWIPLGALCFWIIATGQLKPTTEQSPCNHSL
jgi:membrane protease YdiL (CAAX protease family)